MRSRLLTSPGWIALALLGSTSPTGALHVAPSQDTAWAISSVHAVADESDAGENEVHFRIGLQNTSSSTRRVCRRLTSYGLSEHSARTGWGVDGAMHDPCESPSAFDRVPPGGAHYVLLRTRISRERMHESVMEIRLTFVERRIDSRSAPVEFEVTWRGSVQDALASGERRRH